MDEYMTVELTLDNDEVVECAILTLFEAGGKEYIALLPPVSYTHLDVYKRQS